jgi:hypothetical protein
MNQVEQWFGIRQRKRLLAFVEEWNAHAHPFNWSTKSVAEALAKCEAHAVPTA